MHQQRRNLRLIAYLIFLLTPKTTRDGFCNSYIPSDGEQVGLRGKGKRKELFITPPGFH